MVTGLKVELTTGQELWADSRDFEFEDGVLYVYDSGDDDARVILAVPQDHVLCVMSHDHDSDAKDDAAGDNSEVSPAVMLATGMPDPGPSYRLIDKAVDTPQRGDEIYIGDAWGWVDRGCVDAFDMGYECIYRRRVTPEPVCKREAFSGCGSPSPRECGVCGEGPCEKQPVEEWPKYYVGRLWSAEDAYVRVDDVDDRGVWVDHCGNETDRIGGFPTADNLTLWSWDEVTKEQALARVTQKPQPVESPDDWVTQDRVPYRREFDECRWSDEDVWLKNQATPDCYRHGYTSCGALQHKLQVRCRRKHLPPLPETPSVGDTVVISMDANDNWNGCKRTVIGKMENGDCVVSKTGEPFCRTYAPSMLRVVPKPEST